MVDVFGDTGLVLLGLSVIFWAASHVLLITAGTRSDLSSRILGFIFFVAIFFVSGWKAELIVMPIIFVASFIGVLIARFLREKFYG